MASDRVIAVESGVLEAAAGRIATVATDVRDAQAAVHAAARGGFGGEPIEGAVDGMCARAAGALAEIADTVSQLATNTGAAARGYVSTDVGVIPTANLSLHPRAFGGE